MKLSIPIFLVVFFVVIIGVATRLLPQLPKEVEEFRKANPMSDEQFSLLLETIPSQYEFLKELHGDEFTPEDFQTVWSDMFKLYEISNDTNNALSLLLLESGGSGPEDLLSEARTRVAMCFVLNDQRNFSNLKERVLKISKTDKELAEKIKHLANQQGKFNEPTLLLRKSTSDRPNFFCVSCAFLRLKKSTLSSHVHRPQFQNSISSRCDPALGNS